MGVRFTDEERVEIEEAAAGLSVPPSALIRAGALCAARAGPALLPQEAIAVHRAAGALGPVGRNLNQIARALNQQMVPADVRETVEEVAALVLDLLDAHRALLAAHIRRGRAARRASRAQGA
ncbi:MAG: plasmid mobilization relaxosome protein MobC [Hyphomonadaceae bacterium]|nr:plasmid mobilization relaxosome protein MobC [Hyphomonadaceae bacterium]